ncbi:MAG: hypothetical protein Q9196_005901 [Gyalolechia fulgens]
MLVVKASVEEVASTPKYETYEVACIKSPMETVLAGPSERISVLQGLLTEAGLRSTLLKVPYAFHSSHIDPVLAHFKNLAGGVAFSKAKIPILRLLDGTLDDYLARHSREPVNMLKALSVVRSEKNRYRPDNNARDRPAPGYLRYGQSSPGAADRLVRIVTAWQTGVLGFGSDLEEPLQISPGISTTTSSGFLMRSFHCQPTAGLEGLLDAVR